MPFVKHQIVTECSVSNVEHGFKRNVNLFSFAFLLFVLFIYFLYIAGPQTIHNACKSAEIEWRVKGLIAIE